MSGRQVAKKIKIMKDFVDPATPVDLYLKLLEDQRDWDVVFVVGRAKVKMGARKAILRARSTYFDARFSERWVVTRSEAEAERDEIIVLEDEDPSIFRSFLRHVYAYVFSAGPLEALKLLALAQYYGVQSLVRSCEELLAKTFQPDDFLEIFAMAKKYNLPDVVAKAGDTMAKYFTQLAKSPTFKKADEATLMDLLERDDLNVPEYDLVRMLYNRWAKHQILNSDPKIKTKTRRVDVLKNLLPLVRFPTMRAQDFTNVVECTNILPLDTKCNLFTYFLHPNKEKRKKIAKKFPYSTVPRKSDMACINFYFEKSRPGNGSYPNVALKKCSGLQDILTLSFVGYGSWGMEVVHTRKVWVLSLVLDPPTYGNEDGKPRFQNSAKVAAMNLPIRVAISCSETPALRRSRRHSHGEEVVASILKGQLILTLAYPWEISIGKSYEITARFLSAAYMVPDGLLENEASNAAVARRDEKYDFCTATQLRRQVSLPFGGSPWIYKLSMRTDSSARAGISSGLHLIRSIQVVEVDPEDSE